MFSSSSREGKNGGTQSKCVLKNTSGNGSCGEVARTLKRPTATGTLTALNPNVVSSRIKSSPHSPSLPVVDSMSTSSRVNRMGSKVMWKQNNVEFVICDL